MPGRVAVRVTAELDSYSFITNISNYIPLTQSLWDARSRYAFYVIPGNSKYFTIGLHGGGWCYDEADCAARAQTQLGSSKQWNLTSCFNPPAFSCYGLPDDCTQVFLPCVTVFVTSLTAVVNN